MSHKCNRRLLCFLSILRTQDCRFWNRAVTVIAASIRSFIYTTRSRDFNCVQIRTNSVGAFAAMSEELSALAIVLDIAEPGQHVPVVERKILTTKKRVTTEPTTELYVDQLELSTGRKIDAA